MKKIYKLSIVLFIFLSFIMLLKNSAYAAGLTTQQLRNSLSSTTSYDNYNTFVNKWLNQYVTISTDNEESSKNCACIGHGTNDNAYGLKTRGAYGYVQAILDIDTTFSTSTNKFTTTYKSNYYTAKDKKGTPKTSGATDVANKIAYIINIAQSESGTRKHGICNSC